MMSVIIRDERIKIYCEFYLGIVNIVNERRSISWFFLHFLFHSYDNWCACVRVCVCAGVRACVTFLF